MGNTGGFPEFPQPLEVGETPTYGTPLGGLEPMIGAPPRTSRGSRPITPCGKKG